MKNYYPRNLTPYMEHAMASPSHTNPLSVWMDLTLKTTEMMLASVHVISTRTERILKAGPIPDARDSAEFVRMGTEKVAAATASMMAMTEYLLSLNANWLALVARQMTAAGTAFAALATSKTPAEFAFHHARVIKKSRSAAYHLAGNAGKLVRVGLEPIRARAVANSRRLRIK